MLSGPYAFRGSKFRRTRMTSASVSWISESSWVDDVNGDEDVANTSESSAFFKEFSLGGAKQEKKAERKI